MTDEQPIQIHVDALSPQAHFAWIFNLAERAEIRLQSGKIADPEEELRLLTLVSDFYAAVKAEYGFADRGAVMRGRDRWADDYRAGVDELLQLELIEVERDGTGEWVVTRLHEDRLTGETVMLMGPRGERL